MNIHNKSEKVIVKCILIGVPCDMPELVVFLVIRLI